MDYDLMSLAKELRYIHGIELRLEYLRKQNSDILARFVVELFKQMGLLAIYLDLSELKDEIDIS